MKATGISELPIVPEQHGSEVYERINGANVYPEMTDGEQRFINGLIQYYRPENILEVGVSVGGGTVNLLNSLEGTEGVLYSIDSATRYYRNADLPVGHYAIERYSDMLNNKWHLITGKDPVSVMETICQNFDFCVIDSEHRHPIETLNFISILPWLNDGAIVVMHDTSLFTMRWEPAYLNMLAPRLLLSVVCAEKYIPGLPGWNKTVSNIAAWQVNADTRKYCQNLFDILYLPWDVGIPTETCKSISAIVEKHFGGKMLGYFQEAVRINKSVLLTKEYGILSFEQFLAARDRDIVFYGAGARMRKLITDLEFVDIKFDFPIWDINADKIGDIGGHKVTLPDYESTAAYGQEMVIMIHDKQIADELRAQFEPLGYRIFHGINGYFKALS